MRTRIFSPESNSKPPILRHSKGIGFSWRCQIKRCRWRFVEIAIITPNQIEVITMNMHGMVLCVSDVGSLENYLNCISEVNSHHFRTRSWIFFIISHFPSVVEVRWSGWEILFVDACNVAVCACARDLVNYDLWVNELKHYRYIPTHIIPQHIYVAKL